MLESLFFSSYYAYLKGNLSDCKMYYNFFKEEYLLHPNKNILSKYQLVDLKNIINSIKLGKIIVCNSTYNEYINANISTAIVPQKQPEIIEKIHKDAFSSLNSLIKAREGLHLANIEHPCGSYGAVDMFYMDCETAYPLEVKKDFGDHHLIGQIAKYDLFFKLQLHLKMYQRVQPVTVCHGYDDFTINELKKMGVITLIYSLNNKLTLNYI
jgi:hypothetical protein